MRNLRIDNARATRVMLLVSSDSVGKVVRGRVMDAGPHGRDETPGDREIRVALFAVLRESHADEEDVALLEELGLCRGEVFVDVTLVNGALHGYEIKSDRDSLRRLNRQGGAV